MNEHISMQILLLSPQVATEEMQCIATKYQHNLNCHKTTNHSELHLVTVLMHKNLNPLCED